MTEAEFILGTTTCEKCKSRISNRCLHSPPANSDPWILASYPRVLYGIKFSIACRQWELLPLDLQEKWAGLLSNPGKKTNEL